MSKQNKRKLGYKQFEKLLNQAHQKSEILAQRFKELQSFFIGYVEFNGHNIEFNDWVNKRIDDEISKSKE